jgi:hypothetical protein
MKTYFPTFLVYFEAKDRIEPLVSSGPSVRKKKTPNYGTDFEETPYDWLNFDFLFSLTHFKRLQTHIFTFYFSYDILI